MKQFFAIAVCVLALVGWDRNAAAASQTPNVLVVQKGEGAPFGTRDPRACSSKVAPKSGPISARMAAEYVICQNEKVTGDGSDIWLVKNIKVQVGGSVPYGSNGISISDIASNGTLYLIRGSFDDYLCGRPLNANGSGNNCTLWQETHAKGNCYRNTFGDWTCNMTDLNARKLRGQPPPR